MSVKTTVRVRSTMSCRFVTDKLFIALMNICGEMWPFTLTYACRSSVVFVECPERIHSLYVNKVTMETYMFVCAANALCNDYAGAYAPGLRSHLSLMNC